MKKLIYVLGIGLMLMSCKREAIINYAVISGKIENKGPKELALYGETMDLIAEKDDPTITFRQAIKSSEDGSFRDTLRIKPGNYILYDGKGAAFVYIDEGYNLEVYFDSNDEQNTPTYKGKGSETSTYFYSKMLKLVDLLPKLKFDVDQATFLSNLNEVKTINEELLASTLGLPEVFIEKEKRSINYNYLYYLSLYERNHAYASKNPEFKTSEGFLDELKNLTYDNEADYLYSEDYRKLVSGHYNKQAQELAKSESIAPEMAMMKIAGAIDSKEINNRLLYENTKNTIARSEDIAGLYNSYMAEATDDTYKGKITSLYNILKLTAKGQPSSKFVDYENHAGGTTSLDDLKGKYVYIDVWATWCAPCKAEIPFLKEVEAAYHDKNIEFVSISTDSEKDHDKWKKMVDDMDLGGIQLYATDGFASKFMSDYRITSIPRFILIDPNGNIVSANAPRPSQKELITLFNELNI